MIFSVAYDAAGRDAFGNYWYCIYQDGRLIARFWHDFRGDENGIEFLDGTRDEPPTGRSSDFLEGGGPQPLTLSQRAISYLEKMIAKRS